jgi:AcrR family transcriptional regulator
MVAKTRDLLVTAAARLLDQGGPAAVTLRAVGEAAGVSHNASYKHFANKEELLAAVASRELARQAKTVAGIEDKHARAIDTLKDMMRGYVRWALARPERFRLTYGRWESGTEELAESAGNANTQMIALVKAAQSQGDLAGGDPERIAALMLATAHGAADRALSGHLSRAGKGHADPEGLVDDLFAVLRIAKG